MQLKGKILLPVLIILSIIALLAVGFIFYLYQKESAQNVKLAGQIVELEDLQRRTVGQLEESKKTAMDLGLKLQEAKSKIDILTSDLAAEKTAHQETSGRLEQFKADLLKQKSLREDLENRLNQATGESKQIKEQVKIIQQQKLELEEKIKNLETGAGGVELGKVVVNSGVAQSIKAAPALRVAAVPEAKVLKASTAQQSRLAKGLEGKVMIVNKEFNFVVINLGSKDKINVGDEFLVSRGGKPIGDLKIEKVHEAMSAAGFAVELKDLIKENDLVTQKIK